VPVQPVERKLTAIFAADIAGYSRLMARDGVSTLARLKACRVIIDELIAPYRGRIFNTAGDSVVAPVMSPAGAMVRQTAPSTSMPPARCRNRNLSLARSASSGLIEARLATRMTQWTRMTQ